MLWLLLSTFLDVDKIFWRLWNARSSCKFIISDIEALIWCYICLIYFTTPNWLKQQARSYPCSCLFKHFRQLDINNIKTSYKWLRFYGLVRQKSNGYKNVFLKFQNNNQYSDFHNFAHFWHKILNWRVTAKYVLVNESKLAPLWYIGNQNISLYDLIIYCYWHVYPSINKQGNLKFPGE